MDYSKIILAAQGTYSISAQWGLWQGPYYTLPEAENALRTLVNDKPIPMLLYCPKCGTQHVDGPESVNVQPLVPRDQFTPLWTNPPHRSHLCHHCGCVWRPADVPTTGVKAITTKGKADNWMPNSAAPAKGDA